MDEDTLMHQALAQLGDRMARMEARAERADAHAESAEKERNRQGRELAEFRKETEKRFQRLEDMLEPIAVMSKAQKMMFGWGVAAIGVAGTLVLIWDYFIRWAKGG